MHMYRTSREVVFDAAREVLRNMQAGIRSQYMHLNANRRPDSLSQLCCVGCFKQLG